jgi:putative nucleotidyltransferase with HDIG domain
VQKLAKYTRRFFCSLFPKLSIGDIEFLRSHLGKQEQILFYRMPLTDQKHCINTAYAVEILAHQKGKLNEKMLIKVALLHDIGKVVAPPSLKHRVYSALIECFLPFLIPFLAKRGKKQHASRLCRAVYIKKEHGVLGAELLKELNWGEGPLFLISHHHDEPEEKEQPELTILRTADEAN